MFCLRSTTDAAWAKEAAKDLDAVLVDHAHCEMKAATNAMSLVMRHPSDLSLVRALTDLAREELEHFRRCVAFLERRKLPLGAPPVDTYAAELRDASVKLPPWGMPPIVDRLLVAALIEARSCERFKLLVDVLGKTKAEDGEDHPHDLRVFYEELFTAEARHYRMYVDLAVHAARSACERGVELANVQAAVDRRLALIADAEGKIVTALAARDKRATVHG